MPTSIDLTGRVIGRLTVLRLLEERDKHGKRQWECKCECGMVFIAQSSHLNAGNTKSCGCLAIDTTKATNTKHGNSQHPLWGTWGRLISRCYNPKDANYPKYGGRGITVSDEWRNDFIQFVTDMGPKPEGDYSIDRRDNNGPYCKENCHWATKEQQANNRRSSIFYEFNGRAQTLPAWCRELGLNYVTVEQRIRVLKMSFEKAISTPTEARQELLYMCYGKNMTLGQWVKESGIAYNKLYWRVVTKGMDMESALKMGA